MDLERAIAIAVQAHTGVKDKGGGPYILHPLRVMLALNTEKERIVGVLHDVVEDSHWTFEDLIEEGFCTDVIEGLKSVTKLSDDEDYTAFIQRVLQNKIGKSVKIADITDNLDVRRLGNLAPKELERLNRYKASLRMLTEN